MNYQDGVRVFATGIEDARHEQQTRGQDVRPVVDFKLTVDLSKRSLHEIPDEVVDLLKNEVERWVMPVSTQKGFANVMADSAPTASNSRIITYASFQILFRNVAL